MKKQRLNQLHISHYIKQPQNLKLLILAGTQVQKSQFQTIKRCLNLIKLDLSNNALKHIPILFSQFSSLKIIYLHDNNFQSFDSINIKNCLAQYITLFNNPIKNYRRYLLNHLKHIKAIDKNIVSTREINGYDEIKIFLPCTEIKWPLVEVDRELENQNDYLNLLKGELLVLNDGYFKTYNIEKIELYLRSVVQIQKIQTQLLEIVNLSKHKDNLVKRVVKQWMSYTLKRRKLRSYLCGIWKEYLVFNRIEYRRYMMSEEASRGISNYVRKIRTLVNAKKLLKKRVVQYSQKLKSIAELEMQEQVPFVFYVKQSQQEILNKIFLYVKKILFNLKKYQLCQTFEKEVKKTGKRYLIVKSKKNSKRKSLLMEKVSNVMNTVLIEDYIQKKLVLYNKKGHTQIININCEEIFFNQEQNLKMLVITQKLQNLYTGYDSLQEWKTNSSEIYYLMNKLLRYYNAGNTSKILKNTTAYFQTEIPQQDTNQKINHEKIYVYLPTIILRSASAIKIQSFWRRVKVKRTINCINIINRIRASKKIQKWHRNLNFIHRNRFIQDFYFYTKTLTSNVYYLQLFIYMSLPEITNTLNFDLTQPTQFLPYQNIFQYKDLYELIHKNTKIKTITMNEQSWVKIDFPSVTEAVKRVKLISVLSYRLCYATYVKLFKLEECMNNNSIYQENFSKTFGINIDTRYLKVKNKAIDNVNTLFIYEKSLEQILLKPKLTFLKPKTITIKTSMFVTHQGKKALKLQTDLIIFPANNLYLDINLNPIPNSTQPSFLPSPLFPYQSVKEPPRYSIPLLLEQLSNTKKLRPLRQIRPHKERLSRRDEQSEREIGGRVEREKYRHKSKSMMKSKEESTVSLGSLKLISETMPFKKR